MKLSEAIAAKIDDEQIKNIIFAIKRLEDHTDRQFSITSDQVHQLNKDNKDLAKKVDIFLCYLNRYAFACFSTAMTVFSIFAWRGLWR